METSTVRPHTFVRAAWLGALLIWTAGTSSTAHAESKSLEGIRSTLQAATDDLLRVGVLGTVLTVELPSGEQLSVASGHTDKSRNVKVTPDHSFQIASLTKMFTAAGVLLLIKDGKLSLDQRVADLYDGYIGSSDITVEQLLQHTSGIADGIYVFFNTGIYPTHHFTLEDMIVLSRVEGGQHFEPGTQFKYNEVGVGILGRIIEIKSGLSRAEFLRKRLLRPLGMSHTYFGSEEPWPRDKMAHGYHLNPGANVPVDTSLAKDLSWAISAGDMISTSGDLMKFAAGLLQPDNPSGLVLDDFTANPFDVKEQGSMTGYGYGISRDNFAGKTVWGHGGNIYGYFSIFFIDPASGIRGVLWCTLSAEPGDESTIIYWRSMQPLVTTALHLALQLEQRHKHSRSSY